MDSNTATIKACQVLGILRDFTHDMGDEGGAVTATGRMLKRVTGAIGAIGVALWRYEAADDVLLIRGAFGLPPAYIERANTGTWTLAAKINSPVYQCLRTQVSARYEHLLSNKAHPFYPYMAAIGSDVVYVAPVTFAGEQLGVLAVYTPEADDTETTLAMVECVATQLGCAFHQQRLADQLEQATLKAQRSTQSRAEFLATVGHELRTPLTVLRGWSSMLSEGLDLTPEQLAEGYRLMADSSEHMAVLIDGLMDVAAGQDGRFTIERQPVHYGPIIADTVAGLALAFRQKGLTLAVDGELPDVVVDADPVRLRQVIANLLANALKYTEQGAVTVRSQVVGGTVRTEVADTGVGIASEHCRYLFDAFYRVDGSHTRRVGGIGIGLSVVKQLVEAHGGTLGVESQPGQGSRFWFTLPMSQAAVVDDAHAA